MIKQFYLTHRWNPNKVKVDLGVIAMKGSPLSMKIVFHH